MHRLIRLGAGVLLLLAIGGVSCAPRVAASPQNATITIDGSNGVMPLVAALAESFRRDNPDIVITFGQGMGSGARIRALVERRIDIALASHGLDTEALARDGLVPHRIATSAVVFAVNAEVPVTSLSQAHLCDIFAGRAATWASLPGGAASAIMAVVRAESEVDMEVVRRGIPCLTSAVFGAGVAIADDTEGMRQALLAAPGSIGITTATIVQQSGGRLRALAVDGVTPTPDHVAAGRYTLVRDSYLVTAASPSPAVVRFLAFARSTRARDVLAANGAVSAR